jgi:hypothetical protein
MTGLFDELLTICLNDNIYKKKQSKLHKFLALAMLVCVVSVVICLPFLLFDKDNICANVVFYISDVLIYVISFVHIKTDKKLIQQNINKSRKRIYCVKRNTIKYINGLSIEFLSNKHILDAIISEGESIVEKDKSGMSFTNLQILVIIPLFLTISDKLVESIALSIILSVLLIIFYSIIIIYVIKYFIYCFFNFPNSFERERLLTFLKLINEETNSQNAIIQKATD